MNTYLKRAGDALHSACLYPAVALTSFLIASPVWGQVVPSEGANSGGDIGNIIGREGALRTTLRTVLDFVFFAAAMAGIILIAAGIWQIIKQMKQREEQREMGRSMWMIGGGAALAIVDVLWVWLAQSIVGEAPNVDPLSGRMLGSG